MLQALLNAAFSKHLASVDSRGSLVQLLSEPNPLSQYVASNEATALTLVFLLQKGHILVFRRRLRILELVQIGPVALHFVLKVVDCDEFSLVTGSCDAHNQKLRVTRVIDHELWHKHVDRVLEVVLSLVTSA